MTSLKLKLEIDLILHCARPSWDEEKEKETLSLITDSLNWSRVLWLGRRHHLLPLLSHRLNALHSGKIPAAILESLQRHVRNMTCQNLLLVGELCRLLDLFSRQAIPVISYKGPLFAESAYQKLALRPLTDLEFVIRKEDLQPAKKVLLANGYVSGASDLYAQGEGELTLREINEQALIKLHWNEGASFFSFPISTERLFKQPAESSLRGKKVRVLSLEDLLVTLSIEGTRDFWEQWIGLSDIAWLVHSGRDIHWDQTLQKAQAAGARRMLLASLCLAQDLFNVNLPESVSEKMRSDRSVQSFVLRIKKQSFQGLMPSTTREKRFFYFHMKDSLKGKVFYFLKSLFIPTLEDRKFVNLPHILFFFYPVIRPVRLFARYFLGLWRSRRKVGFLPSQLKVVRHMLELAEVSANDLVYDLGCGDGRIVIMAAKEYGARGMGFDINPKRIEECKANAKKEGVEHLVTFVQQDGYEVDVRPASVVMLYMPSEWNCQILSKLFKELRKGTRIVSHDSDFGPWAPVRTKIVTDEDGATRFLYLWSIRKTDIEIPSPLTFPELSKEFVKAATV